MADIATIQSDACASGIGQLTDPVTLLQVIAQIEADRLSAASPSTSIAVDAILSRACTSGIGKVTDQTELLRLIAQLLNDQL